MRWSRILSRSVENGVCVLDKTEKVVVFGGGSFGTAMAVSLARQKRDLNVMMLLRDPYICKEINKSHINSRYLQVCCHVSKSFPRYIWFHPVTVTINVVQVMHLVWVGTMATIVCDMFCGQGHVPLPIIIL